MSDGRDHRDAGPGSAGPLHLQSSARDLFEEAVRHHQSGRFAEAERLYRQILTRDPEHADSIHFLGVIASQAGQHDAAVHLLSRAIQLRRDNPFYHYNFGVVLWKRGKLAEAETLYKRALVLKPDYAEAHNSLGLICKDLGRFDDAIFQYERAVACKPDYAEAHNNLGNALSDRGKTAEARAHYERALGIKPDYAEAYNNLAILLKEEGRLDEAIAYYESALAHKPDYPEAHNNLGVALSHIGKLDEATLHYRRAIALKPSYAEAYNNLGCALRERGSFEDAIACHRRALTINPRSAEAHNNLANALKDLGTLDEAIAHYAQAVALKPKLSDLYINLGNVLLERGRSAEAQAQFDRARALKPNSAIAYHGLGNCSFNQGDLDTALEHYQRALALDPTCVTAHSCLLFCMNCHSDITGERIFAEAVRWDECHGRPLLPLVAHHPNDRDPNRRIRIGYVSPDFRRHSVTYFLEPLLRAHDHAAVEVFCYADVRVPDVVTQRLRTHADRWTTTVGMKDDELAQKIREDGIDILVDLAGHTGGNRLLTFARKPAPVQVSWLGYPATTGLSTIDYRIADNVTDPPGEATSGTSERLLRVDSCFLCYGPPPEAPAAAPAPCIAKGYVTFGSFNNITKLSSATLRTWAVLLHRLPHARLLLKFKALGDANARDALQTRLNECGVATERITLVGHIEELGEHLAFYREVDIALDPFPYNGTTTTFEALWMGVPVVSLAGECHAGRVGASVLHHLGLDDLIARSVDEYLAISAALADDPDRLASLRRSLRQRIAQSPLCDGELFARTVESTFRSLWRNWCETSRDRP